MKKLVIFDLDGTLINHPSSEKRFFYWLIAHGYIGFKQIVAAFIFILRFFPKLKKKTWVKNKAYLYGLSKEKISRLAEEFTIKNLLPDIRTKIKECLNQHLASGDIVVLLTGSPEFIAHAIAKYLNISIVYATKHQLKNNLFSMLPPTQHPFAVEKLKLTQDLCIKHGIDLANTAAYADSIHDKYLLQEVGSPIAVTPDKKLEKIAVEKNWGLIH